VSSFRLQIRPTKTAGPNISRASQAWELETFGVPSIRNLLWIARLNSSWAEVYHIPAEAVPEMWPDGSFLRVVFGDN